MPMLPSGAGEAPIGVNNVDMGPIKNSPDGVGEYNEESFANG